MILRKSLIMLFFPLTLAAQSEIDSLLLIIGQQFNATAAYNHVKFFSQFWRVAGGKDFNSCIDHITATLDSAQLINTDIGPQTRHSIGNYYIQRDSLSRPVWNPKNALLSVISPVETTLQQYSEAAVMLCKNSFPVDTVAELADVGMGNSELDFAGKDVRGKIVTGQASVNSLFQLALSHGALGVVSSMIRFYNHPEKFPDIISEEGISYSEKDHSFGLKISPRSAAFLHSLLAKGKVTIHVSVSSQFTHGELRTLVAEIPGTEKPAERVIFVAHLDHYKPGANDNASGSATLAEMVSTLSSLIKKKIISAPKRTITFLWVDEYNGTNAWIHSHHDEIKNIIAVFNMDMTGEDNSKTGGQFWMERTPDPASVWLRHPDKHTEWGAPFLTVDKLFPTWLNDFYFSVIQRQAARTQWTVGQHPFEGGSDNEPFLQADVPAVTSWHFTDYFYHSNMDDTDKVSPQEMKNVGTAVLAAGCAAASPNEETFRFALTSLSNAGHWRLNNEAANSKAALDSIGPSQHHYFLQRQKEKEILEAWTTWYDESFETIKRLPISLNTSDERLIEKERSTLRALRKNIEENIGVDK